MVRGVILIFLISLFGVNAQNWATKITELEKGETSRDTNPTPSTSGLNRIQIDPSHQPHRASREDASEEVENQQFLGNCFNSSRKERENQLSIEEMIDRKKKIKQVDLLCMPLTLTLGVVTATLGVGQCFVENRQLDTSFLTFAIFTGVFSSVGLMTRIFSCYLDQTQKRALKKQRSPDEEKPEALHMRKLLD